MGSHKNDLWQFKNCKQLSILLGYKLTVVRACNYTTNFSQGGKIVYEPNTIKQSFSLLHLYCFNFVCIMFNWHGKFIMKILVVHLPA